VLPEHGLPVGSDAHSLVADVRAALGLVPGDRLHLHLTGQRLVLERQQDAAAELRGLAASIPKARSLVDELLAERRLAAAAE
jgi:antitoxin PrlF